ncbi:MAG: hypothetical protein JXR95_07510 [Deltaproteobacteria bacterium]|nr:hypothetical protein [Deltaproteobacteria bacterium]
MEKLVEYFLENLIIDFDGALDLEEFRSMLDNSPSAAKLSNKLKTNDDLNEFILTITDALKEQMATGITNEVLMTEFVDYSES